MKYLALLRGINVGGNSIIKMADLKNAVEVCGFANVSTYIQSGNVIFETDETNKSKIAEQLENKIYKTFSLTVRVIVLSLSELKRVLQNVPPEWKDTDDLRRYIAFVKAPSKPDDVLKEIVFKEGIDFIQAGEGVVYMSTRMSGLMKSNFPKLITKKIYKDMTIRNYNTTQKLLEIMENR